MAIHPDPSPLPRWQVATWASGQVAVQIFRDVPSLLLLFYMTQLLAVPPGLAGAAIFGPKVLWAVLCDYAVGAGSDRFRDRFPRRHFLLAGALLAPVALVLLFTPPDAGSDATARAVHVALMLALYMAVFALFSVPHLAIGAEMASPHRGGAGVMGWRMAFSGVGLLLGGSAAPILLQKLGGDADAYQTVAAGLALVCGLSLLAAWFGGREADAPGAPGTAPRPSLRAAFANPPFRALIATFVLQLTASGLAYACFAYLFTFNLAFPEPLAVVGVVVLISSVCVIAAQPLWVWLAPRIGKKAVFLIGTVGYAAGILGFLLVPPGNHAAAYAAAVVLGVFNSACYFGLFAMLGDVVAADRVEGRASPAGVYSSLVVAADKVAFALGGTLIAGVVLQLAGFDGSRAVQTPEALRGIEVAYAWLPIAFNAAAFLAIARFYRPPALGEAPAAAAAPVAPAA